MSSPPPPPVSGQVGDGGDCWATYAVAQRHSKKQEDKFMVKVLTTGGTPSWADFCCAVLDGHNGKRAAETCAARLPSIVSEELARLCAASGVTYDAPADAASPNWHPQVRTQHCAVPTRRDPAKARTYTLALARRAALFPRTRPPRRSARGPWRRLGANWTPQRAAACCVVRSHGHGSLASRDGAALLHPRRPARSSTAASSFSTGS